MTEQIKADIDLMFSNTRVPVSETRSNLNNIIEHCQMLIETMPEEDEE